MRQDNVAVKGVPCLLGTDIFTGWTPNTDATLVTRILEQGGIVTGKAVCENLSLWGVSCSAASGTSLCFCHLIPRLLDCYLKLSSMCPNDVSTPADAQVPCPTPTQRASPLAARHPVPPSSLPVVSSISVLAVTRAGRSVSPPR